VLGTSSTCTKDCGNGIIDVSENCDQGSGNTATGDGCGPTCMIESGWSCSSTAPSICTTICKDGVLTPPEICDDSNNPLIGCNSTCNGSLNGWTCTPGTPGSTCLTTCGDSIFIS